jgi:type II secretory pathway predicted ATPase ExeA
LNEPPFGLTPNGKFFFEGCTRGAVLDALQHVALDDDGIIVVVGEVGSGKTMLCRMLADRLPRNKVDLVYLANPSFGPGEILLSLLADWGVPVPADRPPLLAVQDALMERHAQGRKVVVLIDEAQAMSPDSLDEIKRLSNLETAQHKLLQIVLFGQPELDELLALPRLRQVRDRVVHRFDLSPMDGDDACAYVCHRLRLAGWQGGALFESRALQQLVAAAGGRARAIHLLADKALLAAFAQGDRLVGKRHVHRAIADFNVGLALKHKPWDGSRVLLVVAMAGALVVAGAGGAVLLMRHIPALTPVSLNGPALPQPAPAPAPAQAAQPPTPPAPAPEAAAGPAAPAVADDLQATLAGRYSTLPEALRSAVLSTRRVFDDPAEQGWTIQVGLAEETSAALRLMARFKNASVVWVHDRQYAHKLPAFWAVYAGRYASREEALAALVPLASHSQAARPLVRTLQGIRTESYPEHAPK